MAKRKSMRELQDELQAIQACVQALERFPSPVRKRLIMCALEELEQAAPTAESAEKEEIAEADEAPPRAPIGAINARGAAS